ncbi:serine protease inhibitor 42Dd-like isoform X1 [Toxorhynchites rutilus septentrionalis]|uniref:serine protease inhibitor 42Dd-like isoform X1 n=1 Tax=Toxorhynchites rutilus septentrionalis TaxID=329112 RepID=UPI0024784A71|nr:serine protease inhibitor 42Dd-like isoform X1 [Toxorhynchites rutilus septentrionalis]
MKGFSFELVNIRKTFHSIGSVNLVANLLLLVCCILPTMTEAVDTNFIRNTNDFALKLYKQIVSNETKNVIISPFSISTCLSFAAMGAAGETAKEMLSVMQYDIAAGKETIANNFGKIIAGLDGNNSLKIANKIYVMERYQVKPSFGEIATKNFRSEVDTVNFVQNVETARTINQWVEQKTNDKIKDLISPDCLDGMTRMVLINAIHFKGTWTHQFNPENTRPMPFWISPNESTDVPMMNTKKHFKYGIFDELGLAALELTYVNNDISMLILLPHERDGLGQLEENLLNLNISDMLTKMRSQEVELSLPKFKIEFNVDLQETLEKLGMAGIFSDSADFSELLVQKDPLQVSKVVHKAFIEVNEEGAEAAAATATVMRMKRSLIGPVTRFNVDHPFMFILQMQSQHIFIGKNIHPGLPILPIRDEL